ncbi:hypothetical protein EDF69_002647 [Sphingomonas sp. JUb134]|nr:hypothetical protein [Sphingomonas sp. JUb134]
MTAIEAVSPKNAQVVHSSAGYRENKEKPWDGPVFDPELRAQALARKVPLSVKVHSVGTPGGAWNHHRPLDKAYETFFVHLPSETHRIKMRLHFSSLEPISNDFTQMVIRELKA